ncbi:LysR family transcriptional regulator [Bradyrhizobium sp. B097]|uniref:LysR family transcriptional regulator n=1 Tax=Bradyrhizobium sp. B097 TaxID=3140244 RepID=UPI0031840D80
MELRHLRYFVATAEELHFTRAAQRLGIAQPPLTQQIKALEAELGLKLFHRLPGRVELTDAGRVFFEDAQRILDGVGRAVARSQSSAKGMVGRLGIGFTESASFSTLVTSSLRRYRHDFPNVELSFEEARTAQLAELLRQGRIDVAFVRPPVTRGNDLTFRPLHSERMVVAVPKRHRLAGRRSLRLIELKGEEFILYPRATRLGLSDMILTACERAGFSPLIAQRAPQISSTINFVAASLGITIVPECMMTSRSDAVSYVHLSSPRLCADLGVAHRSNEGSSVVTGFIDRIPSGSTSAVTFGSHMQEHGV